VSTRQSISDGRLPPFFYITHATFAALHAYFERAEKAKLSTGIALYSAIAYLTSVELKGRRDEGLEKTREEIGAAGGVSATNVTRYAQHLVAAEVLQLEQLVARGANVYRWTLVEPPFQAPPQFGEAGGSPLQGGDTPHHPGKAPLQGGEAYIEEENNQIKEKITPCSPPEGDAQLHRDLFDLWVKVMGRNGTTKFGPKRQRVIRARLREGVTVDELRAAIRGCANSDYHMKRGKHAHRDGPVYDDLTLILRDPEHVEQFVALAPAGSSAGPDAQAVGPVKETEAAASAWKAGKDLLENSLPTSTFRIWIGPLEVAGERGDRLVLVDTSEHGIGKWVLRRYRALILEAVGDFDDIEIVDETQLELEAA
jgi:hypothetical protein